MFTTRFVQPAKASVPMHCKLDDIVICARSTLSRKALSAMIFTLSGTTISRAYACIYKNNKIYCIEGSTNGAYFSNNIAILNQIFTAGQCKTISAGHTYTCTDGNYNGDTITTGYTSLHYETSCTIYGSDSNTGKLICH